MTAIDKSRHDIAAELREISARMLDVSKDIDYYAGDSTRMELFATHLTSTSVLIDKWAHEMEKPT